MNNLVLSCVALASAGVLWLGHRNSVEAARAANHSLHQELIVARTTLAESAAAASDAEGLLALRRHELDWARSEAAAAAARSQPLPPLPPDPAREGLWPKDKAYCYLSKQHLATIGYTPFSEDAGLTSEASILFGMSPAERAAVDRAYAGFLDRIHQMHLAHAEPVAAKPGKNTENHREIAYRIPALTNEFRAVRAEFDTSVQQTLGDSRANVFLKRAQSRLEEVYGQFGNDGYTLKYSADRKIDGTVEHQLSIKRLDGQAIYGYGIRFPVDPTSGMWKYRHIFGDQPLIAIPAVNPN